MVVVSAEYKTAEYDTPISRLANNPHETPKGWSLTPAPSAAKQRRSWDGALEHGTTHYHRQQGRPEERPAENSANPGTQRRGTQTILSYCLNSLPMDLSQLPAIFQAI
jgi:hypothetical protein